MATAKSKPSNAKYYLFFNGDISMPNLLRIIDVLEGISEDKDKVTIDLIINSPGGYGGIAFQMARVLREKCSVLNSFVPFYAKSAGTLLVLASDVIIMNARSELGPLDTQIEHPNEGKRISAIDHVGSLEYLGGVAMELGFKIGALARRDIQLSRLDSIKIGLQFAEEYIKPLVAQLDPTLLYQSQRGLKEAEIYSVELMKDYMFKSDPDSEERSKIIASQLVWNYTNHGFVIDINEATHLGLKIESDNNYPYKDVFWFLVQNSFQDDKPIVSLWSEQEFIEFEKKLKSNSEAEGEQNGETSKENPDQQ